MTDDLATWLRAQLDEDERDWLVVRDRVEVQPMLHGRHLPTFALADIAAKRALLDHCARLRDRAAHPFATEADVLAAQAANWAVAILATAYAHRPGYRQEWRP